EKTAQELHLQVRALSPYPTAFINLKHKETGEITSLKIFESEVLTSKTSSESPKNPIIYKSYQQGTLVIEGANNLFLVCSNNTALLLKDLQLAGKQRVKTDVFLRGFRPDMFSNIATSR
ncbi:MAG: hypothetical protein LBR45_03055, partial [Bacteroidales bacterium]|nr:hypothetical protein [Bacteroidales bacterium]